MKMQQHFVNYLVGFLVMVAICPTTSARSFLDILSKEVDVDIPETVIDSNIDPANSLLDEQPDIVDKQATWKKFVNIELDAPRSGVTIKQGHSAKLVCTVSSSVKARIHWLRGDNLEKQLQGLLDESVPKSSTNWDQIIIKRINSYVIDCASKADEGLVHCVAVVNNKAYYETTRIIVDEKQTDNHSCMVERQPVITERVHTILSPIGTTVILPCKARGEPRPETRWLDADGREIVDGQNKNHFQIRENGDLAINNIKWDDMGCLTCIAGSVLGQDQAETFVYPMARKS